MPRHKINNRRVMLQERVDPSTIKRIEEYALEHDIVWKNGPKEGQPKRGRALDEIMEKLK